MKNKILTTILLAIIIIFSIQLSAQAVVISTDKQVESGSGTVTISVTSNQALGAYTLKITDTAGLTLISAAGGGEVSADKKTITGSSAEGTKSLGTFTFNVPTVNKDSTYNIKFLITGMETPSLDPIPNENNIAVITVKAPVVTPKPDPEPTPNQDPDTKPTVLEFKTVNEIVYATGTVNIRKEHNASSESLGKLKEGDSVTRTGISKTSLGGYYWSEIKFNGTKAYVISSKLTTTKPEEKPVETPSQEKPIENNDEPSEISDEPEEAEIGSGLKSLEIEGITLSPEFKSNVYEYRVVVKKDLSELPIKAVAVEEGATITIAGNKDLKEGENLITIVVYNPKSGETATYQITMNKNTVDLSKIDKLLQEGTLSATKERTTYITVFSISVIGLIVVMILKTIIRKKEDDYEEDNDLNQEITESELDVENIAEKMLQEEIEQEIAQDETEQEISKTRREKRKGKHF